MIGDLATTLARQAISDLFTNLSDEVRRRIAGGLKAWLLACKKISMLPGVPPEEQAAAMQRLLTEWQATIDQLAKTLEVKVEEGRVIVFSPNGEHDRAITLMARGSSWFEPHPGLVET